MKTTSKVVNSFKPNGISRSNQLDESVSILRVVELLFSTLEQSVIKYWRT